MFAIYTRICKCGLLEGQNRISFSELSQSQFANHLDFHKAKHEIPLVDLNGGKTLYGLEALIFILSQKLPIIDKIFTIRVIRSFFLALYNVVSYNRRIIIPAKPTVTGFDCTPDFSLFYRLVFLTISIIGSVLVTYMFGQSLNQGMNISNGGMQMLAIAGTGWILQILAVLILPVPFLPRKRIDYIGHLGVIMLIGVLVLLPGICLNRFTGNQYAVITMLSVLISSGMMSWQHFSRIRHLGLHQLWTVGWFIVLQSTAAFWIYIFYFNN